MLVQSRRIMKRGDGAIVKGVPREDNRPVERGPPAKELGFFLRFNGFFRENNAYVL